VLWGREKNDGEYPAFQQRLRPQPGAEVKAQHQVSDKGTKGRIFVLSGQSLFLFPGLLESELLQNKILNKQWKRSSPGLRKQVCFGGEGRKKKRGRRDRAFYLDKLETLG
jgi:hypothetical protein